MKGTIYAVTSLTEVTNPLDDNISSPNLPGWLNPDVGHGP